ncbi:MAG TPA: hypothetical protein VD997_11890 [Phycisphaerales bacterium]|nr:hypothetical protein [Phycisphaerales bacterium]
MQFGDVTCTLLAPDGKDPSWGQVYTSEVTVSGRTHDHVGSVVIKRLIEQQFAQPRRGIHLLEVKDLPATQAGQRIALRLASTMPLAEVESQLSILCAETSRLTFLDSSTDWEGFKVVSGELVATDRDSTVPRWVLWAQGSTLKELDAQLESGRNPTTFRHWEVLRARNLAALKISHLKYLLGLD